MSLTSPSYVTGVVGRRLDYHLLTDGEPTTFSVSHSPGFGFVPNFTMNGPVLSGTPGTSGTDALTFTVSDPLGGSTSFPVNMTVYPYYTEAVQAGDQAGVDDFSGESVGSTSPVFDPCGVSVSTSGIVYFVERSLYRIRMISGGVVTTIGGSGIPGTSGDGGLATSASMCPDYVCLNSTETELYFSDSTHGIIRKITLGSGVVSKVAGTGAPGISFGDAGDALFATLCPHDMFATATHLYVCDHFRYGVSSSSKIRKIDLSTNIITTAAGAGGDGYSGDGGDAVLAFLREPRHVFVTASGDIYISDTGNGVIRKVDAGTNIITTIIGSSRGPDDGSTSIAATGVVVDPGDLCVLSGDVFHLSLDGRDTVLRRYNPTSGLTTIVANIRGEARSMAMSSAGEVYVAVDAPDKISKLTPVSTKTVVTTVPTLVGVTPATATSDGGKTLTITGTGFEDGCAVYFGVRRLVPAVLMTFVSSTIVTAIVPVMTRLDYNYSTGSSGISVVNPGGLGATTNNLVTISSPSDPDSGVLSSCEILDTSSQTWSAAALMPEASAEHEAVESIDGATTEVRKGETISKAIYSVSSNSWLLTDTPYTPPPDEKFPAPPRRIVVDDDGNVFLATKGQVYISRDAGETFSMTRGLETAGVVHSLMSFSGNMYATTDVGAYIMFEENKGIAVWTPGQPFGELTEVYDIAEVDGNILLSTEDGVYITGIFLGVGSKFLDARSVRNIEYAGNSTAYAQAGRKLYKSTDSGLTWSEVGEYDFMDQDCQMLARESLDLFVSTSTGLFRSLDGVVFSLVDFDRNYNLESNNASMLTFYGTDVVVGYDNNIFSIDPSGAVRLLFEFVGSTPTVRLNGEEARNGFQFDSSLKTINFYRKRSMSDVVSVAYDYTLFASVDGGWNDASPNAPVQVLLNGEDVSSQGVLVDPRTGQVAFSPGQVSKHDVVEITVSGVAIKDDGEYWHEELDDKLKVSSAGLPAILANESITDLLQLGLALEQNMDEFEYESLSERPFTSTLINSWFFVPGRTDYDVSSSTIDYVEEDAQADVGSRAKAPLSAIEASSTQLWIGTEDGIISVDQTNSFSSNGVLKPGGSLNRIKHMRLFGDDIVVVTSLGLFRTPDLGVTFERVDTDGLPGTIFVSGSLGSIMVMGTSDAIYYSDDEFGDPAYGVWQKASFYTSPNLETEMSVLGDCVSMTETDGTLFASVGGSVFKSEDGKKWGRIFQFPAADDVYVFCMAFFTERVYLGTNKGVYSDGGTSRSATPAFGLELIAVTEVASKAISINDLYAASTKLLAVGNTGSVYSLQSGSWSSEALPGVSVGHKAISVSSDTTKVVLSNDQIFASA